MYQYFVVVVVVVVVASVVYPSGLGSWQPVCRGAVSLPAARRQESGSGPQLPPPIAAAAGLNRDLCIVMMEDDENCLRKDIFLLTSSWNFYHIFNRLHLISAPRP